MSQTYTVTPYASGSTVDSDMLQTNDNFAALKSCFSGDSQPSDAEAGMQWYDHTKKVTKRRDHDNAAWQGLMHGDTSQKIWIYRNAAMEGWAVDGGVTDVVLALKGGATYTTGAAVAGSWTQPSCTLDATMIPAHTHGSSGAHTHTVTWNNGSEQGGSNPWVYESSNAGLAAVNTTFTSSSTAHEHTSVGGGLSHNHGTTYRPYAAVGILCYLDL